MDLADATARFVGSAASDQAGSRVALGDVDGDGLADVLIGARYAPAGPGTGTAYVLFGPVSGDVDATFADIAVQGDTVLQGVGSGLDARDIDGDGAGDLLVGASGDLGGKGSAWLFYGPAAGTYTLADADASFLGEAVGDDVGTAAVFGDVDGDGLAEVILGAPSERTGGAQAGAVYVEVPVE
jgi:hypothetical protein